MYNENIEITDRSLIDSETYNAYNLPLDTDRDGETAHNNIENEILDSLSF